MNTAQIKEVLHRRIEEVDERFLKVMYAMAETYMEEIGDAKLAAICKDGDYKPMTKAELLSEIAEANTDIENGNYVTIEELEKEMERW